jgi:hypothetical protein
MQQVRKLHGGLLLGDRGTEAVELAAHWAVVMIVTGLDLWWPRGGRTAARQAAPPQGPVRERATLRHAHLFTGVLARALVLPILLTRLPWTDVWGGGLSRVQEPRGRPRARCDRRGPTALHGVPGRDGPLCAGRRGGAGRGAGLGAAEAPAARRLGRALGPLRRPAALRADRDRGVPIRGRGAGPGGLRRRSAVGAGGVLGHLRPSGRGTWLGEPRPEHPRGRRGVRARGVGLRRPVDAPARGRPRRARGAGPRDGSADGRPRGDALRAAAAGGAPAPHDVGAAAARLPAARTVRGARAPG